MVRNYTDDLLLNRVKEINGFKGIPLGYWMIIVRSNEMETDKFTDKYYIYKGEEFIGVGWCTSTTGLYGLKNFRKWNRKGVAVIKVDEWYHGLWRYGFHKKRMKALVQVGKIKYYRDGDGDDKVEYLGAIYDGIIGINFHTWSYNKVEGVKEVVGDASVGCVVAKDIKLYYKHMKLFENYIGLIDVCFLQEF